MKRIILIIGIILTSSSFLCAQIEITSTSYQSTGNHTYKYEYYEDRDGNKKVEVFNIYNPFEGQPAVELTSRSFTKITNTSKNLYDIVAEYLSPYLPAIVRPNLTIFVGLRIGLDGKIGHVTFIHPQSISFPVEAYEVVETAIKNEHKLNFYYDPDNIEGVYTQYARLYSLDNMNGQGFIPESPNPGTNQPENPGAGDWPRVTNPGAGAIL